MAKKKFLETNHIDGFAAYHHQLNKKPGASPSDILFGSHLIWKIDMSIISFDSSHLHRHKIPEPLSLHQYGTNIRKHINSI